MIKLEIDADVSALLDEPAEVVAGTPIPVDQVAALLARVEPLQVVETADFKVRAATSPPPLTGIDLEAAFPGQSKPAPDAVPTGPPQILRVSPEGEVPVSASITVAFNQPVVSLGQKTDLPVELWVNGGLADASMGAWRAVGTRNLVFEPEDRMPGASTFEVKLASNQAETVAKIETPGLQLLRGWPNQVVGAGTRPCIVLVFDQRVDGVALLPFLSFVGGLEMVTQSADELATVEPAALGTIRSARQGTWVALRPKEPLPAAGRLPSQVVLQKGAPSLEGPRLSSKKAYFPLEIAGEFKVKHYECGWDKCQPDSPWTIGFSNPVDPETFDPDAFVIEPPLDGWKQFNLYGDRLTISGAKPGSTTFEVTLPVTLQDVFGQSLSGQNLLRFRVGKAEPSLGSSTQEVVTLLKSGARTLPVWACNIPTLKVSIYQVEVGQDWQGYLDYISRAWDRRGKPPGQLIGSQEVATEGDPDAKTSLALDLSWGLDQGALGHRLVVVEPIKSFWKTLTREFSGVYDVVRWVQATELGITAVFDARNNLNVLASNLEDGQPRAGATVRAWGGETSKTGPDGVCGLGVPPNSSVQSVLVQDGNDQAILGGRHFSFWGASTSSELLWHTFTDRGMYKPGETARVKGWVRMPEGETGRVLEAAQGSLEVVITDAYGNELGEHACELSANGSFDFTFSIPSEVNLGQAACQMALNKAYTHYLTFDVQEFRRPEFEVSTTAPAPGPYFLKDEIALKTVASYFTGEALPRLSVDWDVTATFGTFRPPGWKDWVFVRDQSPWFWWLGNTLEETVVETTQGRTGLSGDHWIHACVQGMDPPRPVSVSAEARIEDINRQVWASTASLLVHPSSYYVGLRTAKAFVAQGESLILEVAVVDVDGGLVRQRQVHLELQERSDRWVNGEKIEHWETETTFTVTSGDTHGQVVLEPKSSGQYRVVARSADSEDRLAETRLTIWVAGAHAANQSVEAGRAVLIPETSRLIAGQTASLLVSAPFEVGHGLLLLRQGRHLRHQEFALQEGSSTLTFEVEEAFIPGFVASVHLVGCEANGEPAFASGKVDFQVALDHRTLDVQLGLKDGESTLIPQQSTQVDVHVRTAEGGPASNAEVVLWVVDEAILALSAYETPSPLQSFYPDVFDSGYAKDSRTTLLKSMQEAEGPAEAALEPQMLRSRGYGGGVAASRMMPMAAAPGGMDLMAMNSFASFSEVGEGGGAPIAVRSDFDPVACFKAAVVTDEDGFCRVDFKVPDNLTRYRVMANAAWQRQNFGSSETTLTVRLPLTVRPSPPRFVNFGDTFDFGVVVHNATHSEAELDVVLRANNLDLGQASGVGQRVRLNANQRAEVMFPAKCQSAGDAAFQVVVDAQGFSDAASGDFPVYTPATSEALATYGTLDDGVMVQPVEVPADAFDAFGGLEVTTSSTALQALTDAVLYLATYSYDCSEQRASRLLAITALSDVLSAFQVDGGPSVEAMQASVEEDLEMLGRLQHSDGGWGFWERGRSWPIVTIHVTHALVQASQKGYSVDKRVLEKGLLYLDQIERHLGVVQYWRYSKKARWELRAHAAFVLSRAGLDSVSRAHKVVKEAGFDQLSMAAIGWCWTVLAETDERESFHRYAMNHLGETESTALFVERYAEEDGHLLLASDRRSDAVMLWALMAYAKTTQEHAQAAADLVVKLVRGLLSHRKKGHWGSTQENSFVLLALDRYFQEYEAIEPDFVARAWLGEDFAGEHAFKGRTTDRHHIHVPMAHMAAQGDQSLVLQKDGPGRLYYRLGMRFAPRSLALEPLDRGFVVAREYQAVDDPDDVGRRDDGTWVVRPGARVRVTVRMVCPMRRYHVALVDPIPAGFEILNPALAVTESLPDEQPEEQHVTGLAVDGPGDPWFFMMRWSRTWFEHQNFRDERAEAFASLVWEGVHSFVYFARATTHGTFIVPPSKAEEMYSPEVFGRGATDVVVIRG